MLSVEQLGLRDHRWHLDFLSYPRRHTPLFHPTSPVWRFLPRHQHCATSKSKKRLANRCSRSEKRATVSIVESKSSDRWLTVYPGMRIYYTSLWSRDSHQLWKQNFSVLTTQFSRNWHKGLRCLKPPTDIFTLVSFHFTKKRKKQQCSSCDPWLRPQCI